MASSQTQLDPNSMAAALGGTAHGNQIQAPAPGHSKRDRSLSIQVGSQYPEGFVVNPHAGEEPLAMRDYVRRTCGLPEWTPDRQDAPATVAPTKLVAKAKRYGDAHLTRDGFSLAAAYDYVSLDGEVLFQVCRYEHPTKPKTFLQRQPDGRGGWNGGRPAPVIYRWPEIAAAPGKPVYIVEGEKDADTLAAAGLLATTGPNGSWPADLSPLKGRKVYVIPDNDRTGADKADKIVALLEGIATVKRVELPGLPDKGDVTDWLSAGNTMADLDALATKATPVAANQNIAGKFKTTWFDDIEESRPKEHLIKGMLGDGEFSYIVGLPGSGKSAITTDAACHVAAGMEWFGRKIKQGLVIYLAAERRLLTERRMLAFRKRHGVKDVPLLVVGGSVDLTSNLTDANAIVALVKAHEEACGQTCVWIIIDTLTRTFGGGDQNATKDMSRYIRSVDVILNGTDAHVTAIHHSGWNGERAKGSIDLDGAVDSSFLVKKSGISFTLACDGANDGAEGPICNFMMESVEVGIDDDGEPTTAPVIVEGGDAASALTAAIKGHTANALEILKALVIAEGVPPIGHGYPDEILVVTEEAWRLAYYDADTKGTKTDTLGKQFKRAKKALFAAGHVAERGQWVWNN